MYFYIDVITDKIDNLEDIIRIGSTGIGREYEASYFKKSDKKFILYWTEYKDAVPFSKNKKPKSLAKIIKKWLQTEAIYDREPGVDGDPVNKVIEFIALIVMAGMVGKLI